MNLSGVMSLRLAAVSGLLFLLVPGCCAFSVSAVTIVPPGPVYPGDPVNLSCTVYAASGVAFPSYDDLQFTTELEDPVWSYTIMVNGIENVRSPQRGKFLTISGFELSYENRDDVVVKINLKARVPASAPVGAPKQFLRVQELDARSNVITTSVFSKDVLVGLPTPTPTPAFGSIEVGSSPAGANVYLDNVIRGITPLTLEGVANGPHSLLLRQDGYEDYDASVTVLANTIQVNAVLVPKAVTHAATGGRQDGTPTLSVSATPATTTNPPMPVTGSLSITTEPPGALVYIDGESKGITPATIPGLAAGNHTVLLIMDGYRDFQTTTSITPGTTSEFVTGLAKRKQAPGFTLAGALAALAVVSILAYRRVR